MKLENTNPAMEEVMVKIHGARGTKNTNVATFWEKKLRIEQEIAQQKLDTQKKVYNYLPSYEDRAMAMREYFENLSKVIPFTPGDKLYEADRRRASNANASIQMGHPAMTSAAIFCYGVMAAEALVGSNPAEIGCKNLIKAINLRKSILDDLCAQEEDVIVDREQCSVEEFRTACAKIRQLRKEIKNVKAELKTLTGALKIIRKNADETQLALINANIKVAAKKCRDKKKETFGRPVLEAEKPVLKSYKVMHFGVEQFMSMFSRMIKRINDAANNVALVERDQMHTDDELVKAVKELQDTFNKALVALENAKEAGKKVQLDAKDAKIHNARQSQLTDVVGVIYGKTTDMVISVSHDVAKIFTRCVEQYLSDNVEKSNELIRKFMAAVMQIATENGLELKTQPINGMTRTLQYKFWNANNSQLKVGKFVALSEDAYEKASEASRAGMTEEEFEEVWCNGSDLLKWCSYASTPGCPLTYNGEELTINDVLVVKSIDSLRTFANVLEYDDKGTCTQKKASPIKRTMFDGELLFLVPIKSQQIRGGLAFKGFGTCVAYDDGTTMIDEIARREGLTVPDTIEDIDDVQRDWRKYKILCTADCWKWAGWKFGNEKRPFSYAEYCERMNKLAEKYPAVNKLYTCRIADATEESKRRLTRQSIQQFIFATHAQIERLSVKSLGKLKKWSMHDGVLRALAGLDKPEDERTAFERLIEVCPEILNHPYMKRAIEDMFNRQVAEAAVRPEVNGMYPYIAEDPVAFIKIVFFGFSPNKVDVGYLKAYEMNAPKTKDGTKAYLVRYPNNYLCGKVRVQKNDDIYRCVGNVLIISVDGGLLIVADGDTDGDEMCVIFDEVVVEMMTEANKKLKPPMISFPHAKMKKTIIRSKKERAKAVAMAVVIANMYGPEVGKNSNMATKFMHRAALAYSKYEQTGDEKQEWAFKTNLNNAIVAHIAAIIAIDLAKTGDMPAWLKNILNRISKFAGKKMPWNQRFCKDSKATPWFSEDWDEKTLEESDSTPDRVARFIVDASHAMNYVAPTGDNYDVHDTLGSKLGLDVRGSSGKLDPKTLRALDARNYREMNAEGDDEYKIVTNLRSSNPEDKVGGAEMIRFLWRNKAALVYVLQKEGSDKLDNCAMQNSYNEFCRDLLVDFGSFCGSERFAKLDKDVRERSNVYKFVEMAFADKNGIARAQEKQLNKLLECGIDDSELRDQILSAKASFAMFVVKVFAYDLYKYVCEQKGIQDIWKKPVTEESTDMADIEYEEPYNDFGCYGIEEIA